MQTNNAEVSDEIPSDEGLSDSELGKLLSISSSLIYHYRRDGKANPGVVKRLKDWNIKGDPAYRKSQKRIKK
ncbi:hypothetical protein [Pleurocapsa sp. PCC 7319]|uniref:hypothetical protein n=1 Tax=Pleurocapsa sp. PCC 7319 TaxID=118161 RepID=UPI00034538D3|nr:hypothetical protein [Pleurocapsa sp. PCC 7319]